MKSRPQKADEYEEKYENIPKNYYERLSWLIDNLNIDLNKQDEIFKKRDAMMNTLAYSDFDIILYEEPEGAKRP